MQLTAPDRRHDVANRELGMIERMESSGRLQIRLDSGRSISFEPGERHHLDYGYAVTSHSSQGQTADRVLVHVETERDSVPSSSGRSAEREVARRPAGKARRPRIPRIDREYLSEEQRSQRGCLVGPNATVIVKYSF